MIKWKSGKTNATQLTLTVKGGIDTYAKALLQIFNNAREFPNTFLNVDNNKGNDIFIVIKNSDSTDSVIEWLSTLGEITYREEVNVITVYPEYDYGGYQELFRDGDKETLFLVDVE